MSEEQPSGLQYNPHTGEPFIRLASPHDNLVLTPPRLSDAAALHAMMQDPRVYKTLAGPPYPYRESDATAWLALITQQAADALREWHAGGGAQPASACPVRYIREVRADGTDVFLGDIDVHRCAYPDVQDAAAQARLAAQNAARAPGDPAIEWCIGDCLVAEYHGRGIMSAALAALMQHWVVPCMRARVMRVEAFEGNIGSVKVFEKNRFVLEEETVHSNKVTNCGTVVTGYHILWWRAP